MFNEQKFIFQSYKTEIKIFSFKAYFKAKNLMRIIER